MSGFTGSGAGPYAFTVTAGSDGTVTVAVPAGVAQDPNGNDNTASGTYTITYDGAGPAPTITSTAGADGSTTGTAQIPFSVSFDESVTGFASSGITVGGTGSPGTVAGFAGSGAGPYAFTVTAGSDGTVTVAVPAGVAQDPNGNDNTASGTYTITYDGAGPAPTITSTAGADGSTTGTAQIPFSVSFDESVTGFASSGITVGGTGSPGTVAGFAGSGAGPYAFTVTAGSDGTVTVAVPAGVAQDPNGNDNTASGTYTITYDGAGPAPTITSTAGADGSTTGTAQIPFSVSFDESVTGFASSGITVGGTGSPGTVAGFAGSGAGPYAFTVTAGSDGTVTVAVPAGVAQDPNGNDNTASGTYTITYDGAGPAPTITSTAGADGSTTGTAQIPFSVSFDESVTGFASSGITVGGTGSPGTVAGFAGSGAGPYAFTVTAGSDGTVTVAVPAGVAQDPNGNDNTASGTYTITYDGAGPAPTITSTAGADGSTTGTAQIPFSVSFDESVTGFASSGITVGGTGSPGTVAGFAGSGAGPYAFTVTAGSDGTVTVAVPAGVAQDPNGNDNTASGTYTITYDGAGPAPVLTTTSTSTTNADSIAVTVDFGEAIDPATFEISDVDVAGGTASNLTPASGNRTFTFTLTPASDGEVTASIPAGRVADPAGNGNAASDVLRVTFDSADFKPALSTGAQSPTNADSITVTVDFGKAINATTFNLDGDVAVTNGNASGLAHSSGNRTFTLTVTPDNDGLVTILIPAGAVEDTSGNANAASDPLEVTFDRTAPTITILGEQPGLTSTGDAYRDLGATCADSIDGDLTGAVVTSSDVDISVPGSYTVTYTCADSAGNSAGATRTVTVADPAGGEGSLDAAWTVEDIAVTLGSPGKYDLWMISKCGEGTALTGATVGLDLMGLMGGIGTNQVSGSLPGELVLDADASWNPVAGYWTLASLSYDTAKSTISETVFGEGITLDRYMEAGPGEVFEYPDGNYTKGQLGDWRAYWGGVTWEGAGSCTFELSLEKWWE